MQITKLIRKKFIKNTFKKHHSLCSFLSVLFPLKYANSLTLCRTNSDCLRQDTVDWFKFNTSLLSHGLYKLSSNLSFWPSMGSIRLHRYRNWLCNLGFECLIIVKVLKAFARSCLKLMPDAFPGWLSISGCQFMHLYPFKLRIVQYYKEKFLMEKTARIWYIVVFPENLCNYLHLIKINSVYAVENVKQKYQKCIHVRLKVYKIVIVLRKGKHF